MYVAELREFVPSFLSETEKEKIYITSAVAVIIFAELFAASTNIHSV